MGLLCNLSKGLLSICYATVDGDSEIMPLYFDQIEPKSRILDQISRDEQVTPPSECRQCEQSGVCRALHC